MDHINMSKKEDYDLLAFLIILAVFFGLLCIWAFVSFKAMLLAIFLLTAMMSIVIYKDNKKRYGNSQLQ
jgi:VIT1/CCC1 family predicted Fe2+/Mn2+ transporter